MQELPVLKIKERFFKQLHSMGSLRNHDDVTNVELARVAVIMVPFPAQGHLNQLLQLSILISSYGLPVSYVGSAIHNRQAKARVNGLNPLDVAKIHFHDFPTPSFATPPPNPNSSSKFPTQLQPAWDASVSLRQPFATYLREMSSKFKRVIVIHDPLMAAVVQDVASIPNAESYAFNCISAFCQASALYGLTEEYPEEFPKGIPSLEGCVSDEILYFAASQTEHMSIRAGDIYNTCRLLEDPYLDILAMERHSGNRKSWAIGPILAATLSSSQKPVRRHPCLEWLDKQEPNYVIYITFGTTTSLSDEQIQELALGLEESKQKFIWVLRDADKGDIFNGEVRRAKLPEGFEERVKEVGLVEREWAPQPEILAHPSTGGFISHCGWNSCLESITAGVPIAAWPMHSDQPRNAILITDILKIAVVVREWSQREELVKASTVGDAVKRLMASEKGREIRKRAEELAVVVRQATAEGGVSRLELDSFVAHITRENDLLPKPDSNSSSMTCDASLHNPVV